MSALPQVAKIATQVVASIGVSKVISDIIKNNTNVETTADAAKVMAGSLVLGSLIAEQASHHLNARIDSVANWYNNWKQNPVTTE